MAPPECPFDSPVGVFTREAERDQELLRHHDVMPPDKAEGYTLLWDVAAKNVARQRGEDLVTFYETSPGYHRGFCRICGSPILNKAEPHFQLVAGNPAFLDEYGIAFGVLDDDPEVRPERHTFVDSKASWFEITDDLPQHAGFP
jgi:hypothetical protein